MTNRKRHIKTRNLVVCETFDDFAEAVLNIDFTVEDIVGYVTSLTNVYYGNNIESIWGAIGFTWTPNSLTPLSREESIQYPNPLYRNTQVTADGVNITMDDDWLYEHRLSKGTGIFNRTTIPFTHIPSVPDGHRITAITGSTLANINITDGVLHIDKSNWINLNNIGNLLDKNIILYADLDGSNITSANAVLGDPGAKKLYLKADLSNLPAESYIASSCGNTLEYSANISRIIAADDYYKDLHIKIGTSASNGVNIYTTGGSYGYHEKYMPGHPTFQWEGDGPFKLEYFFDITDYNNVYCGTNLGILYINSLNQTYHIDNFRNNDDSNNRGLYLVLHNLKNSGVTNSLADITIDCTSGISDVRVDYDLAFRGYEVHTFNMLPIKYLGNVTSIGIYNPSLKIENDEWPEFRQDLVDKLNNDLGNYIFHNISIVGVTHKCPYTINCENLDYIRIFGYMLLSVASDYQDYDSDTGNDKAIDIYPNIIVDSSKVYKVFDLQISSNSKAKYIKIPDISIRAIDVYGGYNSTLYAGRNTYITFSRCWFNNTFRSYDRSTPFLRLKKLSDTTTLQCGTNTHGILYDKSYINSRNVLDIIDIDSSVTNEDLKAGIINTTGVLYNITVEHPLILSNSSINSYNQGSNYYKNFKLIYNSNWGSTAPISYAYYTDAELESFARCFEDTEDNGVTYSIAIKASIVRRLENLTIEGMSADQYIVSKGYTISEIQ